VLGQAARRGLVRMGKGRYVVRGTTGRDNKPMRVRMKVLSAIAALAAATTMSGPPRALRRQLQAGSQPVRRWPPV
jgi:hypothetical protein